MDITCFAMKQCPVLSDPIPGVYFTLSVTYNFILFKCAFYVHVGQSFISFRIRWSLGVCNVNSIGVSVSHSEICTLLLKTKFATTIFASFNRFS